MQSFCNKVCVLMGIVFLLCAVVTTGAIGASDNRITVEAEGTGSTKMEALKSAWQNAVRQAVGMYMTSKTEMLNDNLTEELAAYSRGQVNSYKTLSESQNNGIWTIKIQANIDRDIMQETVKASKSQNIQIDGGNLAAQIHSQNNKNQDAKDVIRIGDMLNFQDALDYQVSLQTYNNGEAIYARHILKFDLKKFQNWANALEKFVAQRALKKDEVKIDSDMSKRALALINEKEYSLEPTLGMMEEDKSIITNGCYVVYPRGDGNYPIWTKKVIPNFYPRNGYGFRLENNNAERVMARTSDLERIIIFIKNQSIATRYFLSDKAYEDMEILNSTYRLTFYIEAGEGIYAISEPTKREIDLAFPLTPDAKAIFVVPDFKIAQRSNLHFNQCPVLFVFQRINIPVDKLAELKNITGRYTLEPIRKN